MIKDWFRHAKLGIFMHWGIYAVDGITESWSFGQGRISYDEYMKQLDGFTHQNMTRTSGQRSLKRRGRDMLC